LCFHTTYVTTHFLATRSLFKPVFALIIGAFPLNHFFGSQVEIFFYCILECWSELTRVEVEESDTLPLKSGRPI